MFGLSVEAMDPSLGKIDLTTGPQIFKVSASMLLYSNGTKKKSVNFPLVPCTKQHWGLVPSFSQYFDAFGVKKWLCPALNSEFQLIGSQSSCQYKMTSVKLSICKNSTNYNNCAPQTVIDDTLNQYPNFYFRIKFTNPVINPNQPDYIQYYVEDLN